MTFVHSTNKEKINIENLFKNQNSRLKKFISKKIWKNEDVEEVLQLTYLEAIRCKDKFNGESKPETWLFGIASNLTKNYFKRHYKQPHTEEITELLISELQSDIETDPAILIEYEYTLEKTLAAMASLPQETQHILNMIVDNEYSYQEAADNIGVPIGTIRSRLSRARQVLKKCLI
ncbi:RNA polymerase subunit sigma [Marinomonas sp. A3A]|jgi:RNA polymerase sigma factor (sigma-70 family)|uniref:RNA polymerase sigma factor n=1 Tax=Marinomonas TaxID=28253 RepID=UPI001BB363AA|nr:MULTISPECIES: RNA polymerase sigma factor [Marinomonas]QUX90797.1 RNA polymerase subunit sigma [Marinomonas sp. A3A]